MQSGDWTLGRPVMVKEIEQSEDNQPGFWTATIHSLEIELNNESSRCLHLNLTKFLWKIPVDVPANDVMLFLVWRTLSGKV